MTKAVSFGALLLALCLSAPEKTLAQPGQLYPYTVSTVVGNYQYGNNGPAAQALLAYPYKIFIDSKGVVYIADTFNHMVRKVVGGQISVVAGTGIPGFSGDGQPAINAQLNAPSGVAVDGSGNIYIYDSGNQVIRKVGANGNISTIAGTPGVNGSSGDGGPATQAKFALSTPGTVAVDASGNVYIADYANSVVRKVAASSGLINVVAGITGRLGHSGDGGLATAANLYYPAGLALDASGNLYIADTYNYAIRRVSATDGKISTVAGSLAQPGSSGDGGPAKSATMLYVSDVAFDAAGNMYIVENGSHKIRKVTAGANPTISTVAGTGVAGYSGDGGPAISAQLFFPNGVAVDSAGTIYISDTVNNRIRSVQGATIANYAGADHAQGDGGPAPSALLYFPQHLTRDAQGNLFIADTRNNRIRKVTPDGVITTIGGNGSYLNSGDGGPALAAGIGQPQAIAVDSAGVVYLITAHQVRKIDTQGNINVVVNSKGSAAFAGDGGPATTAQLNNPFGLAVDSQDNLYIADTYNHRIRKVAAGVISTVAGTGPICGTPCNFGLFTGDGGPATSANLSFPYDVAFDAAGNMLIADANNHRIRMVDAMHNINTIAGAGAAGFAGDTGPATSALLHSPVGVAADSAGNVYIADGGNRVVRVVDGLGLISTIAGTSAIGFAGDGGPGSAARFNYPYGIVADPSGKVWIADVNNHRIRQLTPSGPLVGNGPLGIVNAASFVSGGLVPGGMATLFGSNLTTATGINLASGLPLATELLKSSVKFNNAIAAPIFAVDNVQGQQQINFQVPWELDALIGSSVVLQVFNNGAISPTVKVPVLAAQPGVFAYNVGADLFGVVLHADFTLADSAHPVTGDEVVLIFCTNLGAVSPKIKSGVAGSGQELTVAATSVTIGGSPAIVSYSGLASGFVGLYQVNAKVPKGLAAKPQKLVVSVSGASSKEVLVPVK